MRTIKLSTKRELALQTEVNIAIQQDFYSKNSQEEVLPTYINNETPAIKITGKDN